MSSTSMVVAGQLTSGERQLAIGAIGFLSALVGAGAVLVAQKFTANQHRKDSRDDRLFDQRMVSYVKFMESCAQLRQFYEALPKLDMGAGTAGAEHALAKAYEAAIPLRLLSDEGVQRKVKEWLQVGRDGTAQLNELLDELEDKLGKSADGVDMSPQDVLKAIEVIVKQVVPRLLIAEQALGAAMSDELRSEKQ